MSDYSYFSTLIDKLNTRTARAVISQLSINATPLRKHLLKLMEQQPGSHGSFLAEPVFEAMFPWEQANKTMAQLSGSLLHPDLVDAMDNPPGELKKDYRFDKDWKPYRHQLESWKDLKLEPKRSVIVTSGTGSGKTECFLVPILDDLVRESESARDLSGVRALFIYPLNALINSQRDRLNAWTSGFDQRVRYCLYNGNTRETVKVADQKAHPQEVLSRKLLRENPPPILVTNSTMLEYMLIRAEDQPIINASKTKLKWIVLDEAHTYLGSQAAEISLLLRRVMIAFEVDPSEVHFIATSATIGDSESTEELRDFMANVAGISREQVSVVEGSRLLPPLPDIEVPKEMVPVDKLQEFSPEECFDVLSEVADIRSLRQQIKDDPMTLSEISQILNRFSDDSSGLNSAHTLKILDTISSAKKGDQTLLPLRVHVFHGSQAGIWCCVNHNCSGRKGNDLDDSTWHWGKVFIKYRITCNICGCPVFELVRCLECKNPFLLAEETFENFLRPVSQDSEIDEFTLDSENLDDDSEESERNLEQQSQAKTCLLSPPVYDDIQKIYINPETSQIIESSENALVVYQAYSDANTLICPCCGKEEYRRSTSFRPARLGAPFLLSNIVPTLLESAPAGKGDESEGPFNGRRLITFTDSRQGTARFAAKMQQNAERSYIRSILYHYVAKESRETASKEEVEKIQVQIDALEPLVGDNSNLQEMLDGLIKQKKDLTSYKPGRLSWLKAKEQLAEDSRVWKFIQEYWREFSSELNSGSEIARLALFREFARRPKWLNNAETLGLLSLKYPTIDELQERHLPPVFRAANKTLQDWKDFLKICLDFHARENSFINISHNFRRWIGSKVPVKFLRPPRYSDNLPRYQKNWPQVNKQGRQSRLVLLLSLGLNLDFKNAEDRDLINECLDNAWIQLIGAFEQGNDGYRLDLEKTGIEQTINAWLCPITRKILDTTFCGLTPYVPRKYEDIDLTCKEIDLPLFPYIFGTDNVGNRVDEKTMIDWLDDEPFVVKGREEGYWSDLNDRVLLQAPYFRVAEHSAQLPANKLLRYESKFKTGMLNILSCSTTMELGVDIGGVSVVAMNNAPPNPANYKQRSGRAGRRQEQTAVSFTLCKNDPHGEMVYDNPKWPFVTPVTIPYVSLNSDPIVRRHVHALLLSMFLQDTVIKEKLNIIRLNCGSFFLQEEDSAKSLYQKFVLWLEKQERKKKDSHVDEQLRRLVQGTSIEGQDLFNETVSSVQLIQENWHLEYDRLASDLKLEKVKSEGQANVAEKAIGLQMKRLEKDYLLSMMAAKGFTPGYGFPTNLASFVTLTSDEINRRQYQENDREDNFFRRTGYPTREMSLAIRDYAPGADIVLDGKVYRSEGVTLNWQLPPEAENVKEIQSIRWAWRCKECGVSGTTVLMPETCSACQSISLEKLKFLEPAGFAVDLSYQPHNDVDNPLYLKPKEPWITVDNRRWVSLPSKSIGRFRSSRTGCVFHENSGENGYGYALCLHCGRMVERTEADIENPDSIPGRLNGHYKLRSGRKNDGSNICTGNENDWAIAKEIALGHEQYTDVFELQLKDPLTGNPIDDQTAMYSLSVALREALALKLGINPDEMGCTVSNRKNDSGITSTSIILFDKAGNGAGFSSSAGKYIVEILKKAREILSCTNNCESSCHACLLRFDTQYKIGNLNRHDALEVLNNSFMAGLELKPEFKYFGEASRPEFDQLDEAVIFCFSSPDYNEMRIYADGDAKNWDLFEWPLFNKVMAWSLEGKNIRIVISEQKLKALPDDILKTLEGLVRNQMITVFKTKEIQKPNSNGVVIAEVLNNIETIRWAVSDSSALVLSEDWGASLENSDFQCIKAQIEGHQELIGYEVTADMLAPKSDANTIELKWIDQLNGSTKKFGSKFWDEISKANGKLIEKLKSPTKLVEVKYSDRFLFGPLPVKLFLESIKALGKIVMEDSKFELIVNTAYLSSNNYQPPSRISNNWQSTSVRDSILKDALNKTRSKVKVMSLDRRDLPHHRTFEFVWEDGTSKTIRLDQGFGYWKTTFRDNKFFNFHADTDSQAKQLDQIDVQIEGRSKRFPTIVYISI
jgi:DEAD/DEAH box helicase domain-containing protein